MALVFYYNDMLQKVTMQRTQQLRPIALAETCRFLAIQSLEFQEIWQKKYIRDHVNDLSRKI